MSNTQDISVRTIPGTSDFIVRSDLDINYRFDGLLQKYFSISKIYKDQFSKSDSNT